MIQFFKLRKKGFTLIELMIVIAIIAILAAILIPNFIRARAQSQLAACESNEKNVATALEMYATDNNGGYPIAGSAGALPANSGNWLNYLRANPICPSNRSAYFYSAAPAAAPTSYSIIQGGAAAAHGQVGIPQSFPQYDSRGGLLP